MQLPGITFVTQAFYGFADASLSKHCTNKGEFPSMAQNMTMTTARLTLAVCLSTILASCASGPSPSAMIFDTTAAPSERYKGGDEQRPVYTMAVPRVYIDSEQLDEDAPESYTVVRGDTLWDISDRFLKEPWRWTEIWGYNPDLHDPHLIFPGDELVLEYVDGKATLMLTRNGEIIPHNAGEPSLGAANPVNSGRVKLSPRIRSEPLESAIPTISANSIEPFLVHSRVVDPSEIDAAPYVIANNEDRLITSMGGKIYVRGELDRNRTNYGVFREHKALIDPVDGTNLGYEVKHVADAKLLSVGDPSILGLTSNKMETIAGDILLPVSNDSIVHNYIPRLPELRGDGRIVSLANAISRTGRDQVVVINVGEASNVQKGDVLAVETRGGEVFDTRHSVRGETVTLPNQRTGVLMVFKTFERVSYALVMESTRPIEVNDIVTGL